jgi:hypothetical protein
MIDSNYDTAIKIIIIMLTRNVNAILLRINHLCSQLLHQLSLQSNRLESHHRILLRILQSYPLFNQVISPLNSHFLIHQTPLLSNLLINRHKNRIYDQHNNHHLYQRKGNDLFITIEFKLFQTIYDFDKIINHLDKRKLHISHTGKTEYNTVRKISGEDMHILNISDDKGDLYIKLEQILPIHLLNHRKVHLQSL